MAAVQHGPNEPDAGELLFGLTLDYFTQTPGLHAAACVMIAYLRGFVVNILIPQEGAEQNYKSPFPVSMGWAPYAVYVLVLTLLHHIYLALLEWLQFGSFLFFLGKSAGNFGYQPDAGAHYRAAVLQKRRNSERIRLRK